MTKLFTCTKTRNEWGRVEVLSKGPGRSGFAAEEDLPVRWMPIREGKSLLSAMTWGGI